MTFKNPILPQRADPSCMLHADGFYYFTATVPEYDRIELRRAKSIGELGSAEAKVIWRKHERGPIAGSERFEFRVHDLADLAPGQIVAGRCRAGG